MCVFFLNRYTYAVTLDKKFNTVLYETQNIFVYYVSYNTESETSTCTAVKILNYFVSFHYFIYLTVDILNALC